MKTQEPEQEEVLMPFADLFAGLLFTLIGLILAFFVIDELRNGLASTNWPHVEGVVREAFVEDASSRIFKKFYPMILYDYQIRAKCSNSQIRFARGMNSFSKEKPQQVVDKYPIQKPVKVYYNPKKEYISVLEPGYTIPWWEWGIVMLHLLLGVTFLRRFYRCSQRLKHGHKNAEKT